MLEHNYEVRCGRYNKSMKEIFKKKTTTMTKALSPKQKVQKLTTEIGGGWHMRKISKGLPPLRRIKLSKKEQYKEVETKKVYMKIIGIEFIGNSNCIGTNLNGLIQEVKSNGKKTYSVSSIFFT